MNGRVKKVLIILGFGLVLGQVYADQQVFRLEHAVVTYSGIEMKYAEALAKTAETARAVAAGKFAFDMPNSIKIDAKLEARGRVRLFNDGDNQLFLTVQRNEDFAKPSESGIFHIYGICHEIGHLAMYRIISDHSWITSDGAEGWAHYIGSRILDEVYAQEKEELWPDAYNYLEDGTARLKKQLAQENLSGMLKAVKLWMELSEIVGDKEMVRVFKAWAGANIDPMDPAASLRKALLTVNAEYRLEQWWNKAEPVLVFKRPKSGFTARTAEPKDLARTPVNLTYDDGKQAGKKSIAGGGHAVRFEVGGDSWYLTQIQIYGSRYGHPKPPAEDFHVWLCDKDANVIADFPQPYAKFKKGEPEWVTLKFEPTNVPSEFMVCVGFNPTATKGVFVGYDEQGSGNSYTGLPGKQTATFSKGDWMIRVRLDQLKSSDALREIE